MDFSYGPRQQTPLGLEEEKGKALAARSHDLFTEKPVSTLSQQEEC